MIFYRKRDLFCKETLERLSSPERLDQVVQIVGPKDWLFLCCLTGIITFALGWSIWGCLPTIVTGKEVVIRPHQIVEFQAPASGRLVNKLFFPVFSWQNPAPPT
jgi:HlyD family secretion protein